MTPGFQLVVISEDSSKPGVVKVVPQVLEGVGARDTVVFKNEFPVGSPNAEVSFPMDSSPYTGPNPFAVKPGGEEKKVVREGVAAVEYLCTVSVEGYDDARPRIVIKPSSARD